MNPRALFYASLLSVFGSSLIASEVYSTSFEPNEPLARYKEGETIASGKNYAGWIAMAKGRAEIMTSKATGEIAPVGQQFLRLHSEEAVYIHHSVVPSEYTLNEPFHFSALTAFRGDASPGSLAYQVAITNWRKPALHAGMQFGVFREDADYRFFWNQTPERGKGPKRIFFGETAHPDTIYRMEATLDPASGTAALRVFIHATGELVAETDHAQLYRQLPDRELGFNFVRINNAQGVELDLDALKVSLTEP